MPETTANYIVDFMEEFKKAKLLLKANARVDKNVTLKMICSNFKMQMAHNKI